MIKTRLLLLPALLIVTALPNFTFGQQTNFSVQVNTGLFAFGGKSAASTSFINYSAFEPANSYTNNPYGNQAEFSYGFSVQVQRLTQKNNLFGLQTGYEMLRSSISIDQVVGYPDFRIHYASGRTVLSNQFIPVYMYAGHRLAFKNIAVDLTAGPELGFCLISREKGKAIEPNGPVTQTNRERNNPGLDMRLRAGATVYYKKIGISAGYSYGLSNYTSNLDGANRQTYARLIGFGLVYQIH